MHLEILFRNNFYVIINSLQISTIYRSWTTLLVVTKVPSQYSSTLNRTGQDTIMIYNNFRTYVMSTSHALTPRQAVQMSYSISLSIPI